jgi:tetratricopeptide (TPR) repeat protein
MGATEEFFAEKLEELEEFLLDPDHCVLRLVIDPEMRRVPVNYLVRREEMADFPHLLLSFAQDFASPERWFKQLLEAFESEIERSQEELRSAGVEVKKPATAPGQEAKPWVRFLGRAESVACSLPDSVASLVFLLEAEKIDDPENFARGVKYLADKTASEWLKFIVIESRLEPVLEDLAEHPKVRSQLFWLSPEEIERRAEADLPSEDGSKVKKRAAAALMPSFTGGKTGEPPSGIAAAAKTRPSGPIPCSERLALATVGLMAFGRKDYVKAEKMQKRAVREAKASKDPLETATSLYNLGNTYIAAERPEEAVEALSQAADGCCYHKLDQLTPMVFTNLGVALHRAGSAEQAFDSLKVARDIFRSQNNRPGEAHVCDCLALIYLERERRKEAEKAWHYALTLYDGIENPAMADVKAAGREDIIGKLKHNGFSHGV